MVKKVSIFLSTSFRKRMEENHEFKESPGVLAALAFPSQLVHAVVTRLPRGQEEVHGTSRFLRFGYSEFNRALKGFEDSARMEANLYIVPAYEPSLGEEGNEKYVAVPDYFC